jgi:hypothetical protein
LNPDNSLTEVTMKDVGWLEPLRLLETRLRAAVDSVSLRGITDGPFLFATNKGRAVEASTNDGQWWIEFWDASDDPSAAPVKEIVAQGDDEAHRIILDWLVV